MKKLSLIPLFLTSLLASLNTFGAARLTDYARDPTGEPRFMNWNDAHAYCADLGTRLPTAREIVEAVNLHCHEPALLETRYPNQDLREPEINSEYSGMIRKGVKYVLKLLPGQERPTVDFYYRAECLGHEFGEEKFEYWSSSTIPGKFSHITGADPSKVQANVFAPAFGSFTHSDPDDPPPGIISVRCLLP